MNILVLNWRDPDHPLAGGAEISLIEQIKVWQKKGANVTWFASGFKGGKSYELRDGVEMVRMGSHYTVVFHFLLQYAVGKFKKTDVIIDCFHFIPFFTPLFVRKKKIVGLINEIAGKVWFDNLFYPFALMGFVIEPFIIRLYKGYTFITGSNSAKKDLIKTGIDGKRIFVVNHGFTKLPKVNVKKEKIPTLIFIGRVSADKGAKDLLRVVENIRSSGINVMCNIVGKFESKDFEDKFRKMVKNFGVERNINIHGFVSEKKKAELIKKSWLLVHPSKKEGWGLNVIEANSLGVPAVGYRVQGLVDSIRDERTGILVDPEVDKLASAIKNLISDFKRIERLGDEAKKWTMQFTWDKAGQKSWSIIKS